MKKFLLLSALSCVPMAEALANATVQYNLEGGNIATLPNGNKIKGKGTLSVLPGYFKVITSGGCTLNMYLKDGRTYALTSCEIKQIK